MNSAPCSSNRTPETFLEIQRGTGLEETIGGVRITRNYFDCAEYFFDGVFNVVRFKKGMVIYHGSSEMANANVEFPIGKSYYDPNTGPKTENKHFSDDLPEKGPVYNLIYDTKYEEITASWYGNYEIASSYSKTKNVQFRPNSEKLSSVCEGKCVSAFRLREDIIMFLLADDYNIAKLLTSEQLMVPEEIKQYVQNMFQIADRKPGRTGIETPFQRFYYAKKHISNRGWDLPFTKWACKNIFYPLEYAGYCMADKLGDGSHMEFIFCDAPQYLDRNLDDPKDWQFRNRDAYPEWTGKLLDTFSLYESTNANFHAGNLLDHSIWSLLWVEQFVFGKKIRPLFSIDMHLLGLSALLHDIGKLAAQDHPNVSRRKYIYYDYAPHPEVGRQIIVADEIPYTTLTRDNFGFVVNSVTHNFGIERVLIENQIATSIINARFVLAYVSGMHWDFSIDVIRDNKIEEYLNKCYIYHTNLGSVLEGHTVSFQEAISYLVLVSCADIFASQPTDIGGLMYPTRSNLNRVSKLLPYIRNVPKVYPGKDTVRDFNVDLRYVTLTFQMVAQKLNIPYTNDVKETSSPFTQATGASSFAPKQESPFNAKKGFSFESTPEPSLSESKPSLSESKPEPVYNHKARMISRPSEDYSEMDLV